jgi:hypothetical protein
MRPGENATERLDRVHASAGDVTPRMTSTNSGDPYFERCAPARSRLERETEPRERVRASGTADRQRPVARSVEVDEQATGDERRIELLRAVEPLLLRDREEELGGRAPPSSAPPPSRLRRRCRCPRRRRSFWRRRSWTTWMRPASGSFDCRIARTPCRVAWRTTVGAWVRPSEAGTRTTTFPVLSTSEPKLRLAAQARTCARTLSSCFGGRGIRVSARK